MNTWTAAVDEHGIIPVAKLRSGGVDARATARLIRAGELTVLDRGWLFLGTPTSEEHRHELATRAMLTAHGGRAVASYHSALVLRGLPVYNADLSRVRLSRLTAGPTRTRPRLSVGRVVPPGMVDGECVTVAKAAVQVGESSGPLAALIAADAALRLFLTTPEQLRDVARTVENHPRTRRLLSVLELADGRRESPGETRLGHALHAMGVEVTPQLEVREPGIHAFVDFVVDGVMVAVEFDGKVKYGRTIDRVDQHGRRVTPQEVLWLEKKREDRLRELGYEVVRVTWAELDDLPALTQRIRAAINRARARVPARTA
ncbi:MAG: hypothetical protein M3Y71_07015 [Actinomycetota bacterium]|nr:hypothetical protein [Actinomycetota bacterium]